MSLRTVIEGNAFYEIDEECMQRREKERCAGSGQNVRQYMQKAKVSDCAEKRRNAR